MQKETPAHLPVEIHTHFQSAWQTDLGLSFKDRYMTSLINDVSATESIKSPNCRAWSTSIGSSRRMVESFLCLYRMFSSKAPFPSIRSKRLYNHCSFAEIDIAFSNIIRSSRINFNLILSFSNSSIKNLINYISKSRFCPFNT